MADPGVDACLEEIAGGLYDIQISQDGDILTNDAFDASIIVSLLSDRRANESEVAVSHFRRGWIGNERTPGIEMGSKLWLYEQSRLNRTSLNGVNDAAVQALQWFVTDGFADKIESVVPVATSSGIRLDITIRRPNSIVEKRFFNLWENTALPCPDLSAYIELTIDAQRFDPYNIFEEAGFPTTAVNVTLNVLNTISGTVFEDATLTTGEGWHPDSTIVVFSNGTIFGTGGTGGNGGGDIGSGEIGGGGGGGMSFGMAGTADDPAHDGSDGVLFGPGAGSAGDSTGATSTHGATNGGDGGAAIEMFHDMTLRNFGLIAAGSGGGGGGGADIGTGGTGGVIGMSGDSGTGTSPGTGGALGNAIEKNGNTLTLDPVGTIVGAIV